MYIAISICLFLFANLQQQQQQLTSAVSNSFYENKKIITELKGTPDGQLFYVEVAIGSEESKQTFNLLVSTTYFMSWIPSLKLNPTRGYRKSAGSHGPKLPGCFGGYKYDIRRDTMLIGGQIAPLEHQPFAVAYPGYRDVYFPYHLGLDGMLGLSDDTLPRGVDYLFKRLYHKGHASKRMFSLYINNSVASIDETSEQSSVNGALVMGGVDERYYVGNITYVDMYTDVYNFASNHNNKSLEIFRVQLDWSERNRTRPLALTLAPSLIDDGQLIDLFARKAKLSLDSSAILFVGPRKILNHIHVDFLGATKLGGSSSIMYAFADCHLDNKPNLVFSLQGIDFSIKPADYVIEHQIDGRKLCLSAFMAHSEKAMWVFGTKFLRKYYTVFDYSNGRIGFATPTT